MLLPSLYLGSNLHYVKGPIQTTNLSLCTLRRLRLLKIGSSILPAGPLGLWSLWTALGYSQGHRLSVPLYSVGLGGEWKVLYFDGGDA